MRFYSQLSKLARVRALNPVLAGLKRGVDMGLLDSIGNFLGGAGQILGGLGVGKKEPDNAFNIALQEQSALRHERDSFNQKMAMAKEHGLHPLSVLGVPTASFSPAISTGDSGLDFSSVGAGAERIAKQFVKPPEEPTHEQDPLQARLIDAQVRNAEAQAKKSEWDALRSQWTTEDLLRGQPGNPPGVRLSNDAAAVSRLAAAQSGVTPNVLSGSGVTLKQDITPPHPSILGHSLGADQSWQRMVDQDGSLYSLTNPSVFNPDIEQYGSFHYLSKHYGVDKALEIMAVLEQAPLLGGAAAGVGYALKKSYDYFAGQGRRADERRGYGPGRGRSPWRARPGTRNE